MSHNNVLSFKEYEKLPRNKNKTKRTDVGGDVIQENIIAAMTRHTPYTHEHHDEMDEYEVTEVQPEVETEYDEENDEYYDLDPTDYDPTKDEYYDEGAYDAASDDIEKEKMANYVCNHLDALDVDKLRQVIKVIGEAKGFSDDEREDMIDYICGEVMALDDVTEVYEKVKKFIDDIVADAEKKAQNESVIYEAVDQKILDDFQAEFMGTHGIDGIWTEGDEITATVVDLSDNVENLPTEYRGVPINYRNSTGYTALGGEKPANENVIGFNKFSKNR